ncbi:hypothetical protein Tco_1198100 [Tanacetum coccineum]
MAYPCLHFIKTTKETRSIRRVQMDDRIFISQDKYVDEILKKFGFFNCEDSKLTRLVARLNRKSTTEGCQFLGSRLISWQCKKQTVVANSTTKAELVANSTTEAEYVVAANCCGQNPVFHSKTKPIEIRHHFIRDSYKIHTDHNVADLPTKALDVSRFQFLTASIGMLNL